MNLFPREVVALMSKLKTDIINRNWERICEASKVGKKI
jgi:hypothetical protein